MYGCCAYEATRRFGRMSRPDGSALMRSGSYGGRQRCSREARSRRATGARTESVSAVEASLGPVRSVYVDFDDTIADGESSQTQLKAVVKALTKRMESPEEAAKFTQERLTLISEKSAGYREEYKTRLMALLGQYPPGQFSLDSINEAMESWAEFDDKWMKTAMQNKVLSGVTREEFLGAASATAVKEHALEAMQAMAAAGLDVAIVSVNGSSEWIQRVMGDKSFIALHNGSSPPEGHIKIYANELFYEGGFATGEFSRDLYCGQDKGRVVQQLLQQSKEADRDGLSVFVGDSFYDIQPLLLVDVGIVIGENKAMRIFTQHFGIRLKPLSEIERPFKKDCSGSPVLYTAESWLEISQTLLGTELAD